MATTTATVIPEGLALSPDFMAELNLKPGSKVVNYDVEYVNGRIHTDGLENFWSLLKRGIGGTCVSVEPFHLSHYLHEQFSRYNNRMNIDDAARLSVALSRVTGKRLTYTEVTGKVGQTAN